MGDRRCDVLVWDPVVRCFHWALAIAFFVAWMTQEEHYELHLLSGYAVLALVIVRFVWGFAGTRHARFADFVRGPTDVLAYLQAMTVRRAAGYVGHNPAGGWMIVAMLFVLTVITLSGIALDAAENRSGPLAGTKLFLYTDRIVAVHDGATSVAVGMVVLHIAGVCFASFLQRENLLRAMITGRKRGADASTSASSEQP